MRHGTHPVVALLLLVSGAAAVDAQVRPPIPTDLSASAARPARNRHPRLDSELNRVILDSERRGERAAAQGAPLSRDASVAVTVHFAGAPAAAAGFLRSRGAIVANIATDLVEAYVPVRELAALEQLPGLLRAHAMVPPQPLATSQGTTVHNAAAWNATGFDGAGVKVGIIDVGFVGYGALIGTELPAPAAARCYVAVGAYSSSLANCQTRSNHGTAVAEAVIDMAPAASLYVSQPFSENDLLTTAQWMISEGVTVINHSVGWSWRGPGDGTSIYSNSPLASVNAAVAGGSVWVNAAGNAGLSTWTGPYQDQDNDAWLEFAAAVELNPVFLSANQQVIVQARWQDTWGAASRDLDVYLFNDALQIVAGSADIQDGTAGRVPFELFAYTAPVSGIYYIALNRWFAASLPDWIQVQNFSGQNLGYSSPAYSIANPAESPNAGSLAAGAAPWYSTSAIEPFSSQGPTIDGRVKPDLVGVDRGDSYTYGAGGFAGTSQAAPHVAGLAALVRQRYPSFGPVDVAQYLKSNAQTRGFPTPNNVWGWGLAFLPTPTCSQTLSATSHSVGAAGTSGSVTVTADCPWTALSNASWITVTGGSSGTGNGVVSYDVASNVTTDTVTPARTGTITIAGNTFSVTQDGCSFALAPTATTFDVTGGSGAVSITAGNACTWTVSGVPAWASTTSGSSGSGTGLWRYDVSGNGTGNLRAGVVAVAGQPFALTQLATAVRPLLAGRRLALTLADNSDEAWASVETVARRSYCVGLAAASAETTRAAPALAAFRADGITPLNIGSAGETALPSTCFIAPATETALFRTTQDDNGARHYLLAATETTLWSNWFFIGGTYSSYTLLRNTTGSPVAAVITWRDAAGLIVGQETVAVPARGVVYRDARVTVTAGTVAGTVEVAHDGRPSALVGSQTTLSATTGLSFDTLLRDRHGW